MSRIQILKAIIAQHTFLRKWLLVAVIAGYSAQINAQTLVYDVIIWGDTVGKVTAMLEETGNQKRYYLKSYAIFSLFGKQKLEYEYENIFRNNILQESNTKNLRNGDLRSYSRIKRLGNGYSIDIDEEITNLPNRQIDYCITSLYFEEPVKKARVFSERFGEDCQLKQLETHKYELELPSGKKNYYSYKDGVLTTLEVDHTLATLWLYLRK